MRAKLMGFIVLMVAVLLGLVWFLGVRSLGTFYEVGVRRELTRTLNAFCTVLDKAGLPGEAGYDDAALLEGLEENTGLLAGKCFEVRTPRAVLCCTSMHFRQANALSTPLTFRRLEKKASPLGTANMPRRCALPCARRAKCVLF